MQWKIRILSKNGQDKYRTQKDLVIPEATINWNTHNSLRVMQDDQDLAFFMASYKLLHMIDTNGPIANLQDCKRSRS